MTQRRIVMFNQVSADGFFADTKGGLDWVVTDPKIHSRSVESMPANDTALFGRKTYEMFAAFWPNALKDLGAAGPHGANKRDPGFVAMANWLNDSRKLVFSRSLKTTTWSNSELLGELDAEKVAAIKQQPGKNILIFGSGSIVSQLTELGLIDEYRFVMCPVLLGQGKSMLSELGRRTSLSLVEAHSFRSGNVMLTYRSKEPS